jgi:hypothetical protein
MGGQTYGQTTNQQIDRSMDKYMNRQTGRYADRQMDIHVGRYVDRQIYGYTDGWIYKLINTQ